MRSFLGLFQSFGAAGAMENARSELQLAESRRVQAALVARHIGTIDTIAAKQAGVMQAPGTGRTTIPSAA